MVYNSSKVSLIVTYDLFIYICNRNPFSTKNMVLLYFKKVFGRIKPKDVFTPATAATINYVKRNDLVNNIHHHFDTDGKQLVVFGYSGSGKTTLITNELQNQKIKHIITRCTQNTTYEQLILNAFDHLNIYYEKSRSCKIDSNLSADYQGLKAQIGGSNNSTTERILPYQLTAEKLATFLGKIECYWIIEDLHKLNVDERRKVADTLKIFIDVANQHPKTKIICLGAVNSSKDLIELDPNLNNRVADIHVPLLSNDEIRNLILNGFNLLNVYIPEKYLKQIIDLSNNIGSVAHQLCLNICHTLNITKSSITENISISENAIQDSVQAFVKEHAGRFKYLIDKIFSLGKIGKQVLLQFSKAELDGISIDTLYKNLSSFSEESVSELLKTLCSTEYEEVIRFDSNAKKFKLANPFFKVYVNMYFESEKKAISKSKSRKRNRRNNLQTYPYIFDLSKIIIDDKQFDIYYKALIDSVKTIKDMENTLKNDL